MFVNYYMSLILGEEDRATGLKLLAGQIHAWYQGQVVPDRSQAIGLPPLEAIDRDVRNRFLDPETGLNPEARAILRTRLGLPAEPARQPATPDSTNAPPVAPLANPAL
jgi:hypothetical protein